MGNLQNAAESKTETETDECKWPRKNNELLQQQQNRQIKKKAQPKLRNNNNNKHRPNICVD